MTDPTGISCCPPSEGDDSARAGIPDGINARRKVDGDAVRIPGGAGLVGTAREVIPDDGEQPLRETRLDPFLIGMDAVTNSQFLAFVDATGYSTEAERFGWSFVFQSQLNGNLDEAPGAGGAEWWRRVDGANWRDVAGPGTRDRTWQESHPVVHVSWNDAAAYSRWVGGRLPTEAEWEHAARGGLGDVRYPWGDEEPDDTVHLPCNIWQGEFPTRNTCADGHETTAPVRSFEPNGYGLHNMAGNVWEWTADVYMVRSLKKRVRERMEVMRGFKLLKGGSYLCHRSYCHRYRIAARTGNSADSTTSHQGFRVVWDVPEND